jgi:hypothetical protein
VACGQPSRADSIWPTALLSPSIACLPIRTRLGCSSSDDGLASSLATASGSRIDVGGDQDAAVAAHGQGRADGFLGLSRADADDDDLGGHALFLQAHGFFDRDLAEGVHGHLDVGEIDARLIRLHANLHVIIDNPFDRD